MKKFIRTLAMLVCVALLMTTVPVETLIDLRAYAEEELVQAVQLPDENPTPEPAHEEQAEEPAEPIDIEPVNAPDSAPTEEPVPELDVLSEEPTLDVPQQEGEQESEEIVDAEQSEATDMPEATEVPEVTEVPEATETPEATENPVVIDYSADAGKSPAFVLGYAEITESGVTVFDGEGESAQSKATIGKGVVYVSDRAENPDRLKITFHPGTGELDEGWVDAACVRPMDPATELHPYFLSCEGVTDLLFYNGLYDFPMKKLGCEYPNADKPEDEEEELLPETEATVEPSQPVTPEETEQPAPEATNEATEAPEQLPEATVEPELLPPVSPEATQDTQLLPETMPETSEEEVPADLPASEEGEGIVDEIPMMLMSMRNVAPETMEFTQDTLRLGVGNTYDLLSSGLIQLTPENAATTYTFKSENENIASVL